MILKPEDIDPYIVTANYIYLNKSSISHWGPRTILDIELILVVDGTFCYKTKNKQVYINSNQLLIIPPNELHSFFMTSAKGTISCIHLEFIKGLNYAKNEYSLKTPLKLVTDFKTDITIHGLFHKINTTFTKYSPKRELLLKLMFKELWLRISEFWDENFKVVTSTRTEQILGYIQANYKANLTRESLAKKFFMSPQHLNFIFRNEVGITPILYINRVRINQAYRLLTETGLSVKQTAYKVGFNNEFYFSKVFKKIMGFPPSRLS